MRGIESWIITDGAAGFEVQALGIAEVLDTEPAIKRVKPPAPWCWLAPWGPAAPSPVFVPPWPDLIVAVGRQSIPYARMIRRRAGSRTFVAVLQDPRVPASWFDFVWVPEHDRLRGPNVFTTLVSPHRVTPARLAEEARRIAAAITQLPHPRIAVLLGGANAAFCFDEVDAARIGDLLTETADRCKAGLMITPSRRTGERQAEIIRSRIRDVPHVMWSGEGRNPYFGYLGSADAILVTRDSVNMMGEAVSTGKPVYVIELEGRPTKQDRFLAALYAHGAARPFRGQIESWNYVPLNATQEIAAAIARAMEAKRKNQASDA